MTVDTAAVPENKKTNPSIVRGKQKRINFI
jgi:hypothetical protein